MNDQDEAWQAEYQKYQTETVSGLSDSSRYRDLPTFKYWFRAIERYCSWVNKIHVITCGHYPEWLNQNHPKLNLIKHEDYIPKRYLPTFSSPVIELNLHRIAELSEHFILFNDDFFVNSQINPDDFFVNNLPKDSLAIVPLSTRFSSSYLELNNQILINQEFRQREIIKKIFPKLFSFKNGLFVNLMNLVMLPFPFISDIYNFHITTASTKSSYEEAWQLYHKELDKGCLQKFRNKESYSRFLVRSRQLLKGKFVPTNMRKLGSFINLKKDEDYLKYLSNNKKILCLNDSWLLDIDDFEVEKERLVAAFEEKFPEKSSFEV
ncbi:MAG: glycosyl transferase [Streptococcaceae bacterium]|nr:glycosyl transferase [Streptococcaceae bacterium]